MAEPTLSVLMPNYNHAGFLPLAVGAILAQSRLPDEVIILDDGSTDNSVEVLKEISRKFPRIRCERNEHNLGVVRSLNKLLSLTRSDYVYFAAADDVVLPHFLQRSMQLLTDYPQAGLCSCLSRLIDEEGRDAGLHRSAVISSQPCFVGPREALATFRRYGTWIQGNTVIYRRDELRRLKGFRAELLSFCDGFAQRVIALRSGAVFIPQPLACWRQVASGYSSVVGSDLASTQEVMKRARSLMRTVYRDLFTESHIADWETEWLWTTAHRLTGRAYLDQRKALSGLAELSDRSTALARLAVKGLGALTWVQRQGMEVHNFIRFGGYPLRWLARRTRSWIHLRKLGLSPAPNPAFSNPVDGQ